MGDQNIEIILPKFGRMQEATISNWLKNVGDRVNAGEPIFSIETDKASQEIEAEASGILSEIRVNAGDVAKVGDVLAIISVEGEVSEQQKGETQAKERKGEEEDLRAVEKIPLSDMRRTIGRRMAASLMESAQLTLMTEVDVTTSADRRPEDVSPTGITVQIVARALIDHPRLNSSLVDDEILIWGRRNIGVAIAVDDGLVVPVIHAADTKDVRTISREIEEHALKAREGELPESALRGGSFTVTNLGMYGVDTFTPILNPPEVAILGVGRWDERPAILDGRIEPRTMAGLSLTIDHRVIDGAPGAAFLEAISEKLERGDYE